MPRVFEETLAIPASGNRWGCQHDFSISSRGTVIFTDVGLGYIRGKSSPGERKEVALYWPRPAGNRLYCVNRIFVASTKLYIDFFFFHILRVYPILLVSWLLRIAAFTYRRVNCGFRRGGKIVKETLLFGHEKMSIFYGRVPRLGNILVMRGHGTRAKFGSYFFFHKKPIFVRYVVFLKYGTYMSILQNVSPNSIIKMTKNFFVFEAHLCNTFFLVRYVTQYTKNL